MTDMQLQQPTVSILIPVFNRENYISECIQSALNQTFTDFEIVVVDNASNDGTWDICQQFSALDPRVRIFRNNSNIGPVRNWMRCTQEARGEYSKILFSDDQLDQNCLSIMLAALDDQDIAFVYCAASVGPTRELSSVAYSVTGQSRLNRNEYLSRVLRNDAPSSPGAILIRTSDLTKNLHCKFPTSTQRPFERHGAGPDLMISLLTTINYKYVKSIAEPLVFFRSHADSFSIINTNNEVTKGYRSVISFFLKSNYSRGLYLNYVSFIWLQEMFSSKKLINPSLFLTEYEGRGTSDEVFTIINFSLKHLFNKISGKRPSFSIQ